MYCRNISHSSPDVQMRLFFLVTQLLKLNLKLTDLRPTVNRDTIPYLDLELNH